MIATADFLPSAWAIRLTATGATGDVLWRRTAGSVDVLVGTGAIVVDRTAAINTAWTYVATDLGTGASVVLDPVTIVSDSSILSSSMYGTAMPVVVRSQRLRGRGRSVWHPVLEPHEPLVTIMRGEEPSGSLELDCPDAAALRALWALCSGGDPLILRSACPPTVLGVTFLAIDWEPVLIEPSQPAGPWAFTITMQGTSDVEPAWTPPPDRTYRTVLDTHPSYQAVLDAYRDYHGLLTGIGA
jgi:hypothetical protein